MAKKKKGTDEDPISSIMRALINGDDNGILGDMYDKTLEMINNGLYHYKRPDYIKGYDRIIPDWLGPMWNAKDNDKIRELCDFVANNGKDVTQEQRHKDFKKYLWNLFDYYKKDNDDSVWQLYGIYWLMEHFGIKDLELVLEALRQDAFFVSHYTMGVEDFMVAALYQNTGDDLQKLKDFMYQQGFVPASKRMVFDAIAMRITRHKEERLGIVSWLVEYLNYSYKICKEGAYAGNVEHYIETLAKLNVYEAMPTIEKIINELDIPFFEYTNNLKAIWHDVKTPFSSSLKEKLSLDHFVTEWDSERGDKEESFWDWLDSYEPEPEPESSLYDVDLAMDKYTITVTWNDYDDVFNPISVQLTVPSNIYLNRLAQLIMIAFGRKDTPSWYFENTWGDYYAMPQSRVGKTFRKEDIDFEKASDSVLSDILTKKNNMARFYLSFPGEKAERWTHNIILEKSGKYGKNTQSVVMLEDAHGVYPSKNDKVAAEYIEKYKGLKNPRPNVKAIRKAIDKFVEEYE